MPLPSDWRLLCLCRFVIGRERPGQQSEVAQLISQTLEQERRQREMMEQQYAQYDADDDEVRTDSRHSLSKHVTTWLNIFISHQGPVGAGSNLLSNMYPYYKPKPVSHWTVIVHHLLAHHEDVLFPIKRSTSLFSCPCAVPHWFVLDGYREVHFYNACRVVTTVGFCIKALMSDWRKH